MVHSNTGLFVSARPLARAGKAQLAQQYASSFDSRALPLPFRSLHQPVDGLGSYLKGLTRTKKPAGVYLQLPQNLYLLPWYSWYQSRQSPQCSPPPPPPSPPQPPRWQRQRQALQPLKTGPKLRQPIHHPCPRSSLQPPHQTNRSRRTHPLPRPIHRICRQ